jgi:hypothetical protein
MVTTLADRLAKKRDTQNWPSETGSPNRLGSNLCIAKSKSLDKGKGRKDRSVHLPARHARGSWELDLHASAFRQNSQLALSCSIPFDILGNCIAPPSWTVGVCRDSKFYDFNRTTLS